MAAQIWLLMRHTPIRRAIDKKLSEIEMSPEEEKVWGFRQETIDRVEQAPQGS